MRNRMGIVLLTVVITALCLFYLSFTFVSRGIEQEAEEYAQGSYDLKQDYLDSIWNEKVYMGFTYGEVKESELNLGLDLQGGMHVTLEVSPVEIIEALSGNSDDETFRKALKLAGERQKDSQEGFTELFYSAYYEVDGDAKLVDVFANSGNRGKIDFNSSEQEVKDLINFEVNEAVSRAERIIRTRIDKFGVVQPNIQRVQGTGRIQLELPGVDNPERVRKLLSGVAKLEFLEVYNIQEVAPYLQKVNDYLVKKMKAEKAAKAGVSTEGTASDSDDSSSDDEDNLFADTDEPLVEGDSASVAADSTAAEAPQVSPLFTLLRARDALMYETKDTAEINDIIFDPAVASLFPSDMHFSWAVKPQADRDGQLTNFITLYVVKRGRSGAPLTGEVIVDANQTFDDMGRADIGMRMNVEGSRKWKKLTGANVGRQVAIVLDDLVYSAPVVQQEIAGGSSSISGNFTVEEAKDLANILKAGKLPAPTRIVEEAVVGPTLGIEAQQQGVMSITIGFVLVVLFMIAYYSKGGMVADLSLLINIFFIIGVLAQLNAALTLPGIAGIVLTIGMAIDANVLIFERIREELADGVTDIKSAVDKGYGKAFWTIFDSNLTTLLTGFFLYTFGSGPIKGFAITLMIGIVCSFFTAVFVSRVFVESLLKRNAKLTFDSSIFKLNLSDIKIDFISKRKVAYGISTVIIVIGLGLTFVNGLNLGVDFQGGRSYIVEFNHDVVASDMKVALSKAFEGESVEAKTYNGSNKLKVTTTYLVDDESAEADAKVLAALVNGVEESTGDSYDAASKSASEKKFVIPSTAKVGATIADDITVSSVEAGLISLVAIFFYILARFRKAGYGLGAIVALFHDSLMVFSMFAIAGALGISFEIDQVFVAALLTVIGYSINDTVVVFDRVREFILEGKGGDLKDILNNAVSGTLNRTLITSFTTLLVVLILLVFGGEVLRGFSFALLIGILFGTYSSIFVATPIVYDTAKEKNIEAAEETPSKEKPSVA